MLDEEDQNNNLPTYTSLMTMQFLTENNTAVFPHPCYSPDLALCNFALFSRIKPNLKGHHFDTVDEIPLELEAILVGGKKKGFLQCC